MLPLVAPEQERDVVGLEDRRVRVAREALRVLERRHRPVGTGGCAPVDRKMLLGRPRNHPAEVGQPPRDGDRKTRRARLVPSLERAERLLEHPLRLAEVTASFHGKPAGDHLMVKRRLHHLDALVGDRLHPREQVLLLPQLAGLGAWRRLDEVVDELVDPRSSECAGGRAAEQLLPCEFHYAFGSMPSSPPTIRSRF